MSYITICETFPLRAGYAGPVEVSVSYLRSLMATEEDRAAFVSTMNYPGVPRASNPVRERATLAFRAKDCPELRACVALHSGTQEDIQEFQVIKDWEKLRRLMGIAASKDWTADVPVKGQSKAKATV
jgi:hypothetical protein